ncbi:MAG: hypothetical protein HGA45_27055, partial [Chloroflexales bacterium]|nr:hypothetical protein [Chloroflexales bacterium]
MNPSSAAAQPEQRQISGGWSPLAALAPAALLLLALALMLAGSAVARPGLAL